MTFLNESDRVQIMEWFANEMTEDVRIVHFTYPDRLQASSLQIPGQQIHYFRETVALLTEIADLSEKIELEIYDLDADAELASQFQIDKAPGTAMVAAEDFGIRYYGVPSGQVFSALVQAVIDVSNGDSRFREETSEELEKIDQDVHLQVFVTPV